MDTIYYGYQGVLGETETHVSFRDLDSLADWLEEGAPPGELRVPYISTPIPYDENRRSMEVLRNYSLWEVRRGSPRFYEYGLLFPDGSAHGLDAGRSRLRPIQLEGTTLVQCKCYLGIDTFPQAIKDWKQPAIQAGLSEAAVRELNFVSNGRFGAFVSEWNEWLYRTPWYTKLFDRRLLEDRQGFESAFGISFEKLQRRRVFDYTYADILSGNDDTRWELYDGELVALDSPSDIHQEISAALVAQLYNYFSGEKGRVYHAPFDVRLFERVYDQVWEVRDVVQPDISVVCDESKLDKHGCKGAPDLIIEILSPSTQERDRFIKYELYQKAGVREYWVVDPSQQAVAVHTLEDGRYHSPVVYSAEAAVPVGVLENCTIDLTTVFP